MTQTHPKPAQEWQKIETAPRDGKILAWCITTCSDPMCAFSGMEERTIAPDGSYGLCLYHGHAEGLSSCGEGLQIVEWGGGWDDNTHEYSGGWMPDWWFRAGSEFEESANPTHWQPLPAPPANALATPSKVAASGGDGVVHASLDTSTTEHNNAR